jgi:hypothetical protein
VGKQIFRLSVAIEWHGECVVCVSPVRMRLEIFSCRLNCQLVELVPYPSAERSWEMSMYEGLVWRYQAPTETDVLFARTDNVGVRDLERRASAAPRSIETD